MNTINPHYSADPNGDYLPPKPKNGNDSDGDEDEKLAVVRLKEGGKILIPGDSVIDSKTINVEQVSKGKVKLTISAPDETPVTVIGRGIAENLAEPDPQ